MLVKDSFVVAAKGGRVTFVYAVAGKGTLSGPPPPAPHSIALSPEILVVARTSPALKIVADPDQPLALFVVRIVEKS